MVFRGSEIQFRHQKLGKIRALATEDSTLSVHL
jgi:hypothetical protein